MPLFSAIVKQMQCSKKKAKNIVFKVHWAAVIVLDHKSLSLCLVTRDSEVWSLMLLTDNFYDVVGDFLFDIQTVKYLWSFPNLTLLTKSDGLLKCCPIYRDNGQLLNQITVT